MSSVSGFLSKTYGIFSNKEHEDICGWGPNGDTIQVKKIDEFSKTILPQYFKHSNFQSFVRQLNMYDFHKTVQDPGNGEFQHTYFLKDRPDLLHLIKRKAHSRAESKQKPPLPQPSSENFSDGVPPVPTHSEAMLLTELGKQRALRADFEKRLADLEAQKYRMAELEEQQARLAGENTMLKHMLAEARAKQDELTHKTEGVLKLLYHMFVSTGGKLIPKGSLAGIPESRLLEFCKYLQLDGQVQRRSLEEASPMRGHPAVQDGGTSSSNEGRPLEKVFSFDSLANSISLPSDKSLLRSDSLERLVETGSNVGDSVVNHRQLSKDREGLALTRSSGFDSTSFDSTITPQGDIFAGVRKIPPVPDPQEQKKRRTSSGMNYDASQPQQDNTIEAPNSSMGPPDVIVKQESRDVPLARLDSIDSTLASLLDFDDDGQLPDIVRDEDGDNE